MGQGGISTPPHFVVPSLPNRAVTVDNLMYIKEDLIIPHVSKFVIFQKFKRSFCNISFLQHYSFYDFIINKARGKSGEWKNLKSLGCSPKNCGESLGTGLVERPEVQSLLFCIGPLFSFDVHDDVRLVNDASVERDEVLVLDTH